jgi:hypothetical protein
MPGSGRVKNKWSDQALINPDSAVPAGAMSEEQTFRSERSLSLRLIRLQPWTLRTLTGSNSKSSSVPNVLNGLNSLNVLNVVFINSRFAPRPLFNSGIRDKSIDYAERGGVFSSAKALASSS